MKNNCYFLLFAIISAIIISCIVGFGFDQPDQPQCEETQPSDIPILPGVCGSLEFKFNTAEFSKLENCTIIEGYLRIIVMSDEVTKQELLKWSFPALREITGSLTLFRVYGLTSLGKLFPNLSVIGGRDLISNYALVVFEMPDLDELGLVNLRYIGRGGVRITKSQKLCYVNTVDWEHLGVDPGAQDFTDNKEESLCANTCPHNCPNTTVGNVESKRCWSSKDCQLGLNCHCGMNQPCMDNGTCCHEYCLGGCTGPGPDECFSCKGVIYQGRCHQECPIDTYKYSDRRCLTADECFAVRSSKGPTKSTKILRSEKAEMRLCVTECPQNYSVREDGNLKHLECVRCEGFCPKVCNGSGVNSIQDAKKLKDCSKIVGNLVIQIMGGSNVAYEMEQNLGSIKEVTGFITIWRSYALLTLYFLKSLEIIGGETLHNNKSSFIVLDNSQLQELFPDEQMRKMKLKNGILSIRSNRKLCPGKIDRFLTHLNLTELDQDLGDNGNLMPCTERPMSLTVTEIFHNTVVLIWGTDNSDKRQLLTYIINYKEIKSKDEDINIYVGRDACTDDTWMTSEALPSDDTQLFQRYALGDLKAYTEYAVYVQAYTLSTASHNSMTNITTFKTNPYYPSEPLDLEVTSDDPHELYVKWKPPKFPNGIVTHYKVLYQKQELDIKSFEQRNYCLEPISALSETKKSVEEKAENIHNVSANCCPCPKTKEEREAEARKREIEIYFENYLHDQVYCQRYDTLPADIALTEITMSSEWPDVVLSLDRSPVRRNVSNYVDDELQASYYTNTSSTDNDTNGSAARNSTWTGVIQEVIVNDTNIYLPNLDHFQEYSIEVQACHDTNPKEPIGTKLCSNRALTAGRTKASWIMDKINESTIAVQIITNHTVDVIITWEPPPKPNGLLLTYNIIYKRASQENLVPQKICINTREFQKYSGGRLIGLDPGNWTFQIIAISLAGNSTSTSDKYFIVPHLPGEEDTSKIVIITTVLAVLFLIVTVTIVWMYAKHRFRKDRMTVISPNANYVASEPQYKMDGWEVDRDKIKMIKELGQGSFGMVYEGLAKGIGDDPTEEIRVAVKTVNDRANFNDKREFLKEATTMKAFDCFHVVKLLGVVSTGQPALVIMELMALGDLKNYLREHRPDEQERPGVTPPKLLDILQMAGEIADGMAYLADMKFVHRDLAARNCMVDEDKTVKIGDFGMTRDVYETDYYRKGGKGMLPVRWMAPESLRDGVFTSMSDVWSYGVVMWEMVTLAAQPYQGLSNEEVVKYISENNVMDIPDGCPQEMALLMQLCWTKKSKNRPTFKQIIKFLLPHLNSRFEKVSYFFNDGGGPADVEGSLAEDFYQAENFDADSIDSQSCGAVAAPHQSFSNISGNFQFRGSPHSSGGSVSLYDDDDMDPERYKKNDEEEGNYYPQRRDSHISESFEDFGDFNIHNEFGLDLDDSSQPFISDDFQAIPLVKTWHPPLLSHDHSGNGSTLHNSGLVELQPLINRNSGPVPSSPRLTSIQSSSPCSSDHIGHHPPSVTTYDLRMPSGAQTLHPQLKTAAAADDSLQSDQASSGSNSGQPNWPASIRQAPMITQPTLRLPTLNQPPSGGFRRVPLYQQEDKSSKNSQRNNELSSGDWDQQQQQQPATANICVVNNEEETSPASSSRQNFPPHGAITSSSDDSKESSKSSGSHSLINGLSNGHIPMMRHKTAPC